MDVGSAEHNIMMPWMLAKLSTPKYNDAMDVGSAEHAKIL